MNDLQAAIVIQRLENQLRNISGISSGAQRLENQLRNISGISSGATIMVTVDNLFIGSKCKLYLGLLPGALKQVETVGNDGVVEFKNISESGVYRVVIEYNGIEYDDVSDEITPQDILTHNIIELKIESKYWLYKDGTNYGNLVSFMVNGDDRCLSGARTTDIIDISKFSKIGIFADFLPSDNCSRVTCCPNITMSNLWDNMSSYVLINLGYSSGVEYVKDINKINSGYIAYFMHQGSAGYNLFTTEFNSDHIKTYYNTNKTGRYFNLRKLYLVPKEVSA